MKHLSDTIIDALKLTVYHAVAWGKGGRTPLLPLRLCARDHRLRENSSVTQAFWRRHVYYVNIASHFVHVALKSLEITGSDHGNQLSAVRCICTKYRAFSSFESSILEKDLEIYVLAHVGYISI